MRKEFATCKSALKEKEKVPQGDIKENREKKEQEDEIQNLKIATKIMELKMNYVKNVRY